MLVTTLALESAALTKVLPRDETDGTVADGKNRETFGGRLYETIITITLFLTFGLVVVVVAVRVGQKKNRAHIEVASSQRVEKIVKMNLHGGNKDNLTVVSVVRFKQMIVHTILIEKAGCFYTTD